MIGDFKVVARLGFEPRQRESESLVLPLHHRAIRGLIRPVVLQVKSDSRSLVVVYLPLFTSRFHSKRLAVYLVIWQNDQMCVYHLECNESRGVMLFQAYGVQGIQGSVAGLLVIHDGCRIVFRENGGGPWFVDYAVREMAQLGNPAADIVS